MIKDFQLKFLQQICLKLYLRMKQNKNNITKKKSTINNVEEFPLNVFR